MKYRLKLKYYTKVLDFGVYSGGLYYNIFLESLCLITITLDIAQIALVTN